MHFISAIDYEQDYTVRLTFTEGTVKRVDLRPHLEGPIFEPLKDPEVFRQFFLHPDLQTIVWPNGADFSPEFLYEVGDDVSMSQKTG